MKRYRISNFSLDIGRDIFKQPAQGEMARITEGLKTWLISKYGTQSFDQKFNRYIQLEKPVISIIAEYTHLLEDVCSSYIQGNLYSSLTGACCLGERIFNDILFKVMDDFKSSSHYKDMYNRGSIIDWEKAIEILSDWHLINNETQEKYTELYKLRTNSVHYQKKEQDLTTMSLSAINAINFIINKIFALGQHQKDMLIYFEVPGEIFIKKEAEKNPLVKAFFIPCSILVGPTHRMEPGQQLGQFKIIDTEKYEDREISDAQFVKLRNEFKH